MRNTICLNMIAKNEHSAIKNCLESVKSLIDAWVIVDTGSTDGTQEIIRETLKEIPGELHERPWIDFAHNRNEALQLAFGKADYILFIDADEEMQTLEGFDKNSLEKDAYFICTKGPVTDHFRLLLIRNDPRWRWEGELHEGLVHENAMTEEILPTLVNHCKRKDGHRSQNPEKFLLDAQTLEELLKKDPENTRTLFYLAQSYGNAMKFSSALHYYQKRASLSGIHEETFWALYCVGHMQEHLRIDAGTVIHSFCKAYQFDPSRAEPLERLANHFQQTGRPLLGYLTARFGLTHEAPLALRSYVHRWVYDYALQFLAAECAKDLKNKVIPSGIKH